MPALDIHMLIKNRQTVTLTVTHECNLRCKYCFEHHKDSIQSMSFETATNAITKYMNMNNEFEGIEFCFSGGEPLLEFELIKDVVDWFHTKKWDKEHIFFIGTNGTILTDNMKKWLIKNKQCVWIGVSLDGNKIAHDLNRSNSYDKVMENLPFFLENWPNQPVKMTINAETIPYVADSIIELEELQIPFTANIVFEDIWGNDQNKKKLLQIYAGQLNRLIDYYVERNNLYPPMILDILPETFIQRKNNQNKKLEELRYCGSGHEMITIDVDGSEAPCHRYAPWITGKPLPTSPANHQYAWEPEKCNSCLFVSACPVCSGFNWQENDNSSYRTTYHCEAFKLQIQAAAKLQMLRLLNKKPNEYEKLNPEEQYKLKMRIDGYFMLAEDSIV